jgi:hypothetical protein
LHGRSGSAVPTGAVYSTVQNSTGLAIHAATISKPVSAMLERCTALYYFFIFIGILYSTKRCVCCRYFALYDSAAQARRWRGRQFISPRTTQLQVNSEGRGCYNVAGDFDLKR